MNAAALLAFTGYALLPVAWWLQRNKKHGGAMSMLALTAALLRTSASCDPHLHPWDERYHALVAKHLVNDPWHPVLYTDTALVLDNADWTRTHTWLHKPPFALWCIAIGLKVFGTEVWAVRLPSIAFAALAVVLLYGLAKRLFSVGTAFWAAMLFAINGHLIELASGRTSTDHIDAIFVCLVLFGATAVVRMRTEASLRWALVAGLCTALAFLTKSWPALLVPLLAMVPSRTSRSMARKRRIMLVATMMVSAAVLPLVWEWHVQRQFASTSDAAALEVWSHFNADVEDHARPWYYYFSQLPMMYGELAPLAIVLATVRGWKVDRDRSYFLLTWVLVPFVIFSLAHSKMPAYTAIASPALFLLIASVVDDPRPRKGGLLRFAHGAFIALLILLPLRFSWDRVRPLRAQHVEWVVPTALKQATANTVVQGCPDPIELMFRTDVAAAFADTLPDSTRALLEDRGYRIVSFSRNATFPLPTPPPWTAAPSSALPAKPVQPSP